MMYNTNPNPNEIYCALYLNNVNIVKVDTICTQINKVGALERQRQLLVGLK